MLAYNEELSGYDIKKWADWSIGRFYWSPSFSQVYSELKRLEKLGYATSRMDRDEGTRSRRMYQITEDGQVAVRRWTRDAPVDRPILKHGVMLRVWLGHLNEPERLKEILAEHMSYMEAMRLEAARDADLARGEPSWVYARTAMLWSERYYAAERDLAAQLITDLDDTAAEFATSIGRDGKPHQVHGRWKRKS